MSVCFCDCEPALWSGSGSGAQVEYQGRIRIFKSVDLKSMLMGGLLALLVVACFAGSPWLNKETFGRFRIVTIERGAFILDTATGQAWGACYA